MESQLFQYRSPLQFLDVAAQLASSLATIHDKYHVHGALSPAVLSLHGGGSGVTYHIQEPNEDLIASAKDTSHLTSVRLPYLAPEQTGRMNRTVDGRADLYSLGAIFYEMLTGQKVFTAIDPMEMVAAHLSLVPESPSLCNPALPEALSSIVLSLLAKAPEMRYQSAYSLVSDLDRCRSQLRDHNEIRGFTPHLDEVHALMHLSEKLYARDNELTVLARVYGEVAKGGGRVVWVAGNAGIGKSRLVREFGRTVKEAGGSFISGKPDQYRREIPYGPLLDALQRQLCLLLTRSRANLASWRQRLEEALGVNGRLMTDVLPLLETIIGPQSHTVPVEPDAALNRFQLVLMNFIQALAEKDAPLVLFLDDLQWIDVATLKFLRLFLTSNRMDYVLVVGAYRENELDEEHPLQDLLNLNESKVRSDLLRPESLTEADIVALLQDSLLDDLVGGDDLVKILRLSSGGNPFFLYLLLQKIHADGLFSRSAHSGKWQCDLEGIQNVAMTHDVVEMMISLLHRLPEETTGLLSLAACVGNRFDPGLLARYQQTSVDGVMEILSPARILGLLIETDEGLCFSHDRVQQAAYDLLAAAQRSAIHLALGRLLLAEAAEESVPNRMILIVDQFAAIPRDLIAPEERIHVAGFYLAAGRQARDSVAFDAALDYFRLGLELLPDQVWKEHYGLALDLHSEGAEAALLCHDHDLMISLSSCVLEQGLTLLDRVKVYEIKINGLIALDLQIEAVEMALPVLAGLGVSLPYHPDLPRVLFELLHTKWHLAGCSVESLGEMGLMSDPAKLAAMRILSSIGSSAYLLDPKFFLMVICATVKLSKTYGIAPQSAFGYAGYGIIQSAHLFDICQGIRFGRLALKLLDQPICQSARSRVILAVNHFIFHWQRHLVDNMAPMVESHLAGMENGDFEYASWSKIGEHIPFWMGWDLVQHEKKMSEAVDFVGRVQQKAIQEHFQIYHQTCLNLLGRSKNPTVLAGNSLPSWDDLLQKNNQIVLYSFCHHQVLLSYLFGDYERIEEWCRAGKQYSIGRVSVFLLPIFYFYVSLSLLAVMPQRNLWKRLKLKAQVAINQKKMKFWARHAPMNYLHKYHLVEAERFRLKKRAVRASHHYQKAVELARKHGFISEEALAHELAGRFFLDHGDQERGRDHLFRAVAGYRKWGAVAKVDEMEGRYAGLLSTTVSNVSRFSQQPGDQQPMVALPSSLDWITVIKASQIISGEIEQSRLLEKMLMLMVENAGAQRGVLLLSHLGDLFVEAEFAAGADQVLLRRIGPVAGGASVPLGLIHYVERSRETLVLADASEDEVFGMETYFQEQNSRSVMCVPLMRQGQIQGILYLENSLATGVFTDDRMALLNLLASQAVISLQNAGLFRDLQEMNSLLREEISNRKSLAETLQQSEKQYRMLADNVTDVIWTMDMNLRYTYCSPSVKRMRGYTVEEAMAQELADVLEPDSVALVQKIFQDELALVTSGNRDAYRLNAVDLQIRCKDGRLIWVENRTIFLQHEDGTPYGILGVTRNINERKMAEADLVKSHEKMRNLSRHLQDVREQERSEIARDIHDELGQSLTALNMQVSLIDDMVPEGLQEVRQRLQVMGDILNDTVGMVQRISSDLRPMLLDHLGLKAAIEWQIEKFTRQSTIQCRFEVDPHWHDPGQQLSTTLFRILQEALTNVARHSGAEKVDVLLARQPEEIRLTVRDHGRGITMEESSKPTAFGLMGMRERCMTLGGSCEIMGEPGRGTTLAVVIPDPAVFQQGTENEGDEDDTGIDCR